MFPHHHFSVYNYYQFFSSLQSKLWLSWIDFFKLIRKVLPIIYRFKKSVWLRTKFFSSSFQLYQGLNQCAASIRCTSNFRIRFFRFRHYLFSSSVFASSAGASGFASSALTFDSFDASDSFDSSGISVLSPAAICSLSEGTSSSSSFSSGGGV